MAEIPHVARLQDAVIAANVAEVELNPVLLAREAAWVLDALCLPPSASGASAPRAAAAAV